MHQPDENGDKETASAIRNAGRYVCSDNEITAIECNATSGKGLQHGVICGLNTGLVCQNADLPYESCSDYEVRFYCKCPPTGTSASTSGSTWSTATPIRTSVPTSSTTSEIITGPTTSSSTPSSTVTPTFCPPGGVTCEMTVNWFFTFDGLEYQYDICNHVLMKDKYGLFYVNVHKNCSQRGVCFNSRYVVIGVDSDEIKLGPGLEDLSINNDGIPTQNLWRLKESYPDFIFRKEGNNLVVTSRKYSFEVTWGAYQNVKITMQKCSTQNVAGLCGFYSGRSDDDLQKPDGSLTNDFKEFGDSWIIGKVDNCIPSKCPQPVEEEALSVCLELLEYPFESCQNLLRLTSRFDICKEYMCECLQQKTEGNFTHLVAESCKCKAYTSFVEACERISGKPVQEWRLKHGCGPDCPPGMERRRCGPGCQLTCDNYHKRKEMCKDQCVPGCYCPPGLVKHGNKCVKPKECGDCECEIYGDPNYITFDRQPYAFRGNCTYVAAQSHFAEYFLNFQVLVTNTECPEAPHSTCATGVQIIRNGHKIEIRKDQPVSIDGTKLKSQDFTFEYGSFSIEYVPKDIVTVRVKDINLVVKYNHALHSVIITVPSLYYLNKTRGLCGICNFVKSDDMYHRGGYITGNIPEFAYSWLVENSTEECQVVTPPVPPTECSFPSSPCDKFLDSTLYSKSCVVNDTDSVCRSKLQYARQCCQIGISLTQWLFDNGCSNLCDVSMELQCTTSCPRTCENYKNDIIPDCNPSAVLACGCPPDKVLKDGRCVGSRSCEICDKEGHVVGEEWLSPDGDPCKTFRCIETPPGKFTVQEKVIECVRNCSQYSEYVEPERGSPTCCGACKLMFGCLHNGVIYPEGKTWENPKKPCFVSKCTVSGRTTRISYVQKVCPDFPRVCPKEYVYFDDQNCCKFCGLPKCGPSVIPENETVQYFSINSRRSGLCTNNQAIKNFKACVGRCDSKTIYNTGMNNFERVCKCCVPERTEKLEVQLDCDSGSQMTKIYEQPVSCRCADCLEQASIPLPEAS